MAPVLAVLTVVAWGGWLTVDAADARRETGAAVDLVATMQRQALAGEHDDVATGVDAVLAHAAAARTATRGPHWSAARVLPWLGNDVAVVQTGIDVMETLAVDVLPDLAEIAAAVEPSGFVPRDGRVDVQPLIDVQPLVVTASHRVDAARGLLGGLPEQSVLPAVAEARADLGAELEELAAMLSTASRAVQLLPAMLGAEGERRYLVLVQDPADPRAAGGVPVPVQIRAEDGGLSVDLEASAGVADVADLIGPPPGSEAEPGAEASRGDVPLDGVLPDGVLPDGLSLDDLPPGLSQDDLPPGLSQDDLPQPTSSSASSASPEPAALSAFPGTDRLLVSALSDALLTPDFPQAAALARDAWQEHTGEVVDGVLTIDPGALGLILEVTGPVTMVDGTVLDAENAADLLAGLTDPGPRGEVVRDVVVLLASLAVFDAVMAAGWEPAAMGDAVAQATGERRVLLWSAHEDEQQLLSGTAVSGEVRGHEGRSPVIGVFVNDETETATDYHLGVDVVATTVACRDNGSQEIVVRVDVTSLGAPGAADPPPSDSAGTANGSHGTPGVIGAQVLLYAPTGGVVDSVEVTGMPPGVQPQREAGLSVVGKRFTLEPGAEATIEYRLRTGPDRPGLPILRTTPLAEGTTATAGLTCG